MQSDWIGLDLKACLVACALLFLLGCGGVPLVAPVSSTAEPQAPNAKTNYRMDLPIKVNGVSGVGMLVVPKASTYQIEVRSPGNPEQVMLSTCHRDYPMGKQDDKFTITYTPNAVESRGFCMVRITVLGQKFTYAGAVVDMIDGTSLPAKLYCNGGVENAVGVGKCQSKVTLPQEIHFEVPVVAGSPAGCPVAKALLEGRQFEIKLGAGLCVYAFREIAAPNRVLRLDAHGYEIYRDGAK